MKDKVKEFIGKREKVESMFICLPINLREYWKTVEKRSRTDKANQTMTVKSCTISYQLYLNRKKSEHFMWCLQFGMRVLVRAKFWTEQLHQVCSKITTEFEADIGHNADSSYRRCWCSEWVHCLQLEKAVYLSPRAGVMPLSCQRLLAWLCLRAGVCF